jgi:redox-sensitive bicupin YhaK (pirin superfamily)
MRGPFVMNTKAELAQAFDDYADGSLGRIPRGAMRPYRG